MLAQGKQEVMGPELPRPGAAIVTVIDSNRPAPMKGRRIAEKRHTSCMM